MRDFILDWYNNVTNDVEFVQEAFELFEHLFSETRKRVSLISRHDFTEMVIDLLTNHYLCYKTAQSNIKCNDSGDSGRNEQLTIIEYEKLNSHRSLSNIPQSELAHQRAIVLIVLKCLLPADYKLTGPSLLLVRELISCNVLAPLLQLMARPEQVYTMIHNIFGESEVGHSMEAKDNIQEELPTKVDKNNDTAECTNTPPQSPSQTDDSVECNNSNNNDIAFAIPPTSNNNNTLMSTSTDSDLSVDHTYDLMPIFPSHFAEHLVSTEYQGDTDEAYRTVPLWCSDSDSNKDCLFRNLCIAETSTMSEPYQTSLKYTLYKVTYFAVKKSWNLTIPFHSKQLQTFFSKKITLCNYQIFTDRKYNTM